MNERLYLTADEIDGDEQWEEYDPETDEAAIARERGADCSYDEKW